MTPFRTKFIPALIAKIFADRPAETIWEFAEKNVFFDATMAPEPGPYDSEKTPWTRRIQELVQQPSAKGDRVRKIVVMKSSQTGFTEAILNCIRWFAARSPRNVIYAIDSKEEAGNISDRLIPTLKALGEDVFTGDDDDEKRFALKLRYMKVWFYGSFSAGKFANKQAPFGVCDEYEEHGRIAGDTTSLANLESRMKKSAEGLVVVLSKPKVEGGPIHEEFLRGNQEIFMVPCPHCGTYQQITFESMKFDHCKNLLGEWDKSRVLRETEMKCAATECKESILDSHRREMVRAGRWVATAKGDPGVISMQISDLYDVDTPNIWGQIALEIINSKGDPVRRMGVYNHRLGLPWRQQLVRADRATIIGLRGAYKRGTVPFTEWMDIGDEKPVVPIILGADVGLDYVRWMAAAFSKDGTMAVVDWGSELHPEHVRDIALNQAWGGQSIRSGGMDLRYRREDVLPACLSSGGRIWPVLGSGGQQSRAPFALGSIPTFENFPWFKSLTFNDRDFKTELYIERIPNRRLMVPMDIETPRPGEEKDAIINELCAERLEENRHGHFEWTTAEPGKKNSRPNHFGDCAKICCVMWRYLNRKRETDAPEKTTAS